MANKIGLINSIVVSNLCSLEDKYGNGFFFSQEDMANTCCMCLDTIKKSIAYLKTNKFLKIGQRLILTKNFGTK